MTLMEIIKEMHKYETENYAVKPKKVLANIVYSYQTIVYDVKDC